MTTRLAWILAVAATACNGDHRETPDAAPDAAPDAPAAVTCGATPVATLMGHGTDARGNMHTVELSQAMAAYYACEMTIQDPTGEKLPGSGLHFGAHGAGTPCALPGPGSYGASWKICWEQLPCHALSGGEGEFVKFDRLDSACIAGSFHLVGGPTTLVPGDLTGTFSIPQ